MNGFEGKKNPWGRGAEYEKELTPAELAAVRFKKDPERAEYERIQERLREMPGKERERYYADLQEAGRAEDTFKVSDSGKIYIDPERSEKAALWTCAPLTEDIAGKRFMLTCTPDDLMRAAQQIAQEHPDVHFDIDYRPPHHFSYVARIKERSE